ncbi:MAG: MFS transporter [Anaerolineaceae bacterium]|nr:MFS transporter [Anaerolineaceae bacterium]
MKKVLTRPLMLILGFVFLDLLGYSLILPLLPYYAEGFGATIFMVGLLGTVNALGQLIAAPIIGRLSDRYGRRPLLIFSIAGTLIAFIMLAFSQSLWMIFLSRIVDGLFGGNMSLAKAYITDISEPKNRARSLGLIGASFGLGFIIGPVMGGVLGNIQLNLPAIVAAVLSLINLLAVIFWLPESLPADQRGKAQKKARTSLSFNNLLEALRRPCVGPLLNIRLFYSLAFTLFQSTFSLYAKETLNLSLNQTGLILTYVGVLSVLVQALAIGKLTQRFRERDLTFYAAVLITVTLILWGFTKNVWLLLVVLAPIALAAGVLNTVLSSLLTKSVEKEDIGGTLGLDNSMQTFAQLVSPGLGGYLLGAFGSPVLGLAAGGFMLFATLTARSKVIRQADLADDCYSDEEE